MLKKLAGDTAIYGFSSILGRLLNYLLVPLYTDTSILSTSEYGVSTVFFAYAAFATVIFTYGMETAFFRFYQKQEQPEKVFSTALISLVISSFVMFMLIVLFASPISGFSDNPGRESLFRLLALALAADAITTVPFAWLRQRSKAKRFATLRLLNIATNICLNLFFYLLCPWLAAKGVAWAELIWRKEWGVTYMFIANAAASLIVLPFFSKEFGMMRLGFDKALWKEMLWYALPLVFMGFAGMINETLDRILLKYLIPNRAFAESQVGIYSANYKLSILITLFIQAFRMGAEPFFFARAKEKNAPETYALVMRYFVIVCACIFLLVTLYLDIFKHFIRSKAYWEGLHVVPILLLANICLGMYYNLSIWYKITDKTKLGAVVAAGGAIITLILNWWWIPVWGYTGSAWATLICYFSMLVISYLQGQRYFPVPYPLGRIGMYIGLALLTYGLSEWLKPVDFLMRIGWNSLLFGAYLACIALVFERDFLRSALKKS